VFTDGLTYGEPYGLFRGGAKKSCLKRCCGIEFVQKLALRAADVFILPDAYETKQEGKYLRCAKICVMLNGTEYA